MKTFGWCILALAACAVQVQGYSSGGPLCSLTPRADHGTLSENSAAEIEIRDANNNAVSEYVGGTTYTYWVSAPGANTYKGYTVVINQGTTTQTAPSSSACAGTMSTASNGQVRSCSGCNYASHNNGQDKTSTSGTWVAPATGTGTITVQFMWTNGIGSNFARWAAKQFNEQPGGTPSPSPSPAPPASCTTPAAPCSGHGACSIATAASGATSISCACQSLWSGDGTCSTCTPGWTLTNGACTLAPTSATVVTLFFTGSLDTVAGAAGSDSRSNFVDALEAAVEALLGLSASGRMLQSASGRVRVTGLSTTASGFDSDVTILPGSAGQPNVTALASTLVAGARDSSSSLYSAPLIGAALDASTNAASASSTVTPTPSGRVVPSGAGCPSFAFSADLTDGLTLQWSIATSAGVCLAAGDAVPSGAALVGQLTHANAGTWLAMGFNDAFAMVGTDAILGLPATSEVRDVHITGRSGSGVVTDASNDLTDTGISSTGSTTVMTFTRPLDTGDSDDMDIASAVASEESVRVIWAHGAAGSGSLTNHGSTRRGNILVNFATGETEEAAPDGMRLAHGIMMTIAWAVMVPLGVLSAVWVKPGTEARCCGLLRPAVAVDGSVPQTWFLLHWRLQMGATLLSTIAFILAIVFTGGAPPATLHASLGIVVYVLMALHVIAGLLRPGKPKAPEPSASAPPAGPATPPTPAIRTAWEYGHRIVGSLLPLLALVAIISGYLVFGSEVGIAVGVPLGLLAASLAFGVCTLRSCVPDQRPGKVFASTVSTTVHGTNPLVKGRVV